MNLTHLHLLINHVAVIGAFSGMIVLAFAFRFNSKSTYYAAYTLFLLAAIGASVAYATGESAEESVEGLPGVTENVIEAHEDAASFALASFIVLGVLSVGGIFISMLKESWQSKWATLLLIVSLFSFVVVSRTALLGGQIRHTELTNTTTQDRIQESSEAHDDD